MKSPVVRRSIIIAGHKTSVSLEEAFWKGLKEIAMGRDLTLSDMVTAIDYERATGNLSSALRLFVLDHYCAQIGIDRGVIWPRHGAVDVMGKSDSRGRPPISREYE
jgi:predicted DNA-binding ribbon-helix-helix protein